MGQSNSQVEFIPVDQQAQQSNTKQKGPKIFKKQYKVVQMHNNQQCELPNCKCPATHETPFNLKICSKCDNPDSRNFRKNAPMNYLPTQKKRKQFGKDTVFDGLKQTKIPKQTPPVHQASPIYYYNAWSLPIQKCFVQRTHKPLTDTAHTQTIIQDGSSDRNSSPDSQSSKSKSSFHPKPIEPPYDYGRVNPRDRIQNLFLYDRQGI